MSYLQHWEPPIKGVYKFVIAHTCTYTHSHTHTYTHIHTHTLTHSHSHAHTHTHTLTHTHTQSFSQDSCKPTKLVSVVTRVKRDPEDPQVPTPPRPMSDGVVYGNYNERRIEYEDVLLSERTDSQFSQSESCISEG